MGGLFTYDQNEMLTFFAVLVRFSILVTILPFVGDMAVPMPVKALMALGVSLVLYPVLVADGQVRPAEAAVWGSSAGKLVGTIATEATFGLILGFTARIFFDAISMAGNVAGTFMGYAMASAYDPHVESQSQVVAKFQGAIAMLIFLVLDGHHLMLSAALESYRFVSVGQAVFGAAVAERLLELSGMLIRTGLQIAAPVAISLYATQVVYGVMAKAMPQLNILVLSFAVSALVGLFVMLVSIPGFHDVTGALFEGMGDGMRSVMHSMR